jgi:hypothetical protein
MGRPRKNRDLPQQEGPLDVDASDVAGAIYPDAVPQNPDGTVKTEGEISVEQAQNIGAIDLVSAAHNERMNRVKMMKLSGSGKQLPWNAEDALEQYDNLRTAFAGEWATMKVHITRIIPEPATQFPPVAASSLKSSADLYTLVDRYHGYSPGAATYQVRFVSAGGAWRASAPLSLPDKSASAVMSAPPPLPAQGSQGFGGPPVVVNMPPQQTQPRAESGQGELIQAILAQGQAQTQMMMGVLKDIVDSLKKPQMPPGFIPLPEGWPEVPKGYTRVPGGCVPEPQVPQVPQVVHVPTPAGPVAVPVQAVAAPQDPAAQMASLAKSFGGFWRTMQDLRSMIESSGDMGMPDVPEGPPVPAAPPVTTTPIAGGLSLVSGPDGKTIWPATILGAIPKIMDSGQKVVDTYGKLMEKQAAMTQKTIEDRIRLANAVASVPGRPPVLPQAPPMQTQTASPPPAPKPVPPIVAPAARKMPESIGALWGPPS